ncbi:MAG: ABC transporter permease subunit, partial [Oscillospiraceae bacterium]|nr:ABC transporter permease subunit [Oscillospiraceae bacterium]
MKKRLISAACVLFWLAVWQVGAMILGQELLLVSPVRAVGRLLELIPTEGFLRSAAFSSARILGGFGLGLLSGTLLALLAGKFRFVRTLLSPLVTAVKAVPVASITVLALVWVSSRNLSVLVTFLIALPVVYSNMLESLASLDPQLTEMAELYHISGWRRFAGVYLSQLLPGFRSAAELAIGLSWKSGAAAEVIGIPSGSIGEKLYEAKVYLETADLFAWTIAVIILSWLSEKLFLLIVGLAVRSVSGKNAFPCKCARAPEISPAVLHVEGVTKRFGGHAVLDGFSAVFQPGKTTAVMGASGCGKTTLLRIISGLLPADSGSVGGQGAGFSAVFQEDRLCSNLTAAANVRLVCGGYRSDGEIAEAFAAVG